MARYWLNHWRHRNWRNDINREHEPVHHAASNTFRRQGVSPGDMVYIVSMANGRLLLGGRMKVNWIGPRDEAIGIMHTDDLHKATDHVIGEKIDGTPLNLHRELAPSLCRRLRVLSPNGNPQSLSFVDSTHLSTRATGRVRELTPDSAALLDLAIEVTDRLPRSDQLITVTEELIHIREVQEGTEEIGPSEEVATSMSVPQIPAIATMLDSRAPDHPIGKLQDIRTELKNLTRRPGHKIFSQQTTFEDYAFHHGGRSELQFNIGWDNARGILELRYGVAFSFERSQALPSLHVLVPKIKYFNDYILLNAEFFNDMRMWHYYPVDQSQRDTDNRSSDYLPGPISPDVVAEGFFVFLGSRQLANAINYEAVLDDFDRLLPLYEYVESEGRTQPITVFSQGPFVFKSGCSLKSTSAKAISVNKEIDLDLRHNELQRTLYEGLVLKHGRKNVGTELPSGVGTKVDIVVRQKNGYWFYEIKTALTPRACLREALGQLLEYAFWPGAQEATRLIVAGESALDKEGEEYLRRLKALFALPIEYEHIII